MQFECPLCEERFVGHKSSKNNSVQCPSCSHQFGADGTSPSNVPPPIKKNKIGAESESVAADQVSTADATDDALQLRKAIPGPKVKSTWKALAALVGLTTLCASLIGVLYYTITNGPEGEPVDQPEAMVLVDANGEPRSPAGSTSELDSSTDLEPGKTEVASNPTATSSNRELGNENSDAEPKDAAGKSDAKKKANKTKKTAAAENGDQTVAAKEPAAQAPMKEPKFTMINSRTADAVWDQTQPYLVSLEVESPFGEQRAVGMVVDSRGWMQTSLNACIGSKRIRVTESVNSLMRLQSKKPLTDLVRGVIAFDQAGDLALLSINRRFTTLNKIQLSSRDFVVKGRRLIQCTPPSEEFPYPIAEIQILDRGKKDKLKKRNQALMERIVDVNGGLKSQPIDWIVHTTNEATCPGAPLVDEKGAVQAVNAFQIDGRGFAVPIVSLIKLINTSSDKTVASLATLAPTDGGGGAENSSVEGTAKTDSGAVGDSDPANATPKTELDVLPFGHPLRDTSLALNQNAKACDTFGWAPAGQANYRQIQTAIESFYDVEQLLVNHAHDESITSTLSTQTKYWTEHIVDSLQNAPATELVKNTNTSAASVIQSEPGYFMAMARLEIVDVRSDLLIMKVIGTDCYISFPFDETIRPMRPDETWILFGKTPPIENAKTREIDSKMVTHYTVHVFHQLGKIKVE